MPSANRTVRGGYWTNDKEANSAARTQSKSTPSFREFWRYGFRVARLKKENDSPCQTIVNAASRNGQYYSYARHSLIGVGLRCARSEGRKV